MSHQVAAKAEPQLSCLQSLVKLEQESMEERVRLLERLERAVEKVNVRGDLNDFVEHEKEFLPNGRTKLGDVNNWGHCVCPCRAELPQQGHRSWHWRGRHG